MVTGQACTGSRPNTVAFIVVVLPLMSDLKYRIKRLGTSLPFFRTSFLAVDMLIKYTPQLLLFAAPCASDSSRWDTE